MAETLPRFEASDQSPKLEGPGIALKIAPGANAAETVVRGSWRLRAEDRVDLAAGSLRGQIWLIAIARESRLTFIGRPAAELVLFPGDEPASGPAEGWFHVSLGECCAIPKGVKGLLDVTAVLGPWKSSAIEVTLKA